MKQTTNNFEYFSIKECPNKTCTQYEITGCILDKLPIQVFSEVTPLIPLDECSMTIQLNEHKLNRIVEDK